MEFISNLDENLSSNVNIICYNGDEYEESKTIELTLMNTFKKESENRPMKKHSRIKN